MPTSGASADNNTVERVDVAILARDADRVFVDAQLKAGDKVVNEGGGSLRPTQTVRVITADAGPQSATGPR